MKITQVQSIMTSCANQLLGAGYFHPEIVAVNGSDVSTGQKNEAKLTPTTVTALTVTDLVDIGQACKDYQPAFDMVFNCMVDQLGKMVIDDRKFIADLPDLFVDPIEWGGFVEWTRVSLSDIMDDPMWDPNIWQYNYNDVAKGATGTQYAGEVQGKAHAKHMAELAHGTYLPKTRTKMYQEAHAIMVALSTYKQQMFTAFKGWDEANKFLSALLNSVENTLRLKAKCFAMATVVTGIATSWVNGHAYNILEEAHKRGIETSVTTAAAAMNNDKIKAFTLEFIQNTKDQMREMTTCFNDQIDPTFTPEEDNRLLLNAQWANNLKYSIRANTFNEQLLGIGNYKKVACWQGISTTGTNSKFDTATCQTVKVTADAISKIGNTSPSVQIAMNLYNVVGFMYDKMGLGMTLDKESVTTQYSAPEDKVNSFWHGLFQYFCNGAYNMATFYFADHTPST